MQGQLEVCDLEECDFLQVKIEEYFNVNDYESDILIDPETQMIVDGKTGDNLSKGLMIAYSLKKKDTDKFDLLYEYSPWSKPLNELLDWRDKTLLDLEEKYKENNELTILLASHNMKEVERLCSSIVMMKQGQIVDQGTCAELIKKHGRDNLEETFLKIARSKNEFE